MKLDRRHPLRATSLLFLSWAFAPALGTAQEVPEEGASRETQEEKNGLVSATDDACEGYTLFGPLQSRDTVLVNLAGEVVHRWTSEYTAGQAVYLLENGDLLRAGVEPTRDFSAGGAGGRVERFDWDGNLVWTYVCCDENRRSHHDIEPLPNGNVLIISWQRKTQEEAIAMGRDADAAESGMWPDSILEIEPILPEGGNIVWEWHVWDHLVQDRDPDLPNFGVVAEHPERIDVNVGRPKPMTDEEIARLRALGYLQDEPEPDDRGRGGRSRGGRGGGRGRADWNHTNGVSYNPQLDQILISMKSLDEIFIIDHSTTTEEAAGSTGGRAGRGGDLLWRWGNPANYGHPGEQQLRGQHDAHWVAAGLAGEGNILVYNNDHVTVGRERFSAVLELELPLRDDGTYEYEEGFAYGPEEPCWSFGGEDEGFYSGIVSGSRRLPNDNTLITTGTMGQLLEVTPEGDIAWKYVNPIVATGRGSDRGDRGDRGGRGEEGRGERGPDGRGEGGPGGRGRGDEGPGRGGRDEGGPPGGFGRGEGGPPGGFGGRGGRGGRGGDGMARTVFRAIRYAPDHPAFEGRLK